MATEAIRTRPEPLDPSSSPLVLPVGVGGKMDGRGSISGQSPFFPPTPVAACATPLRLHRAQTDAALLPLPVQLGRAQTDGGVAAVSASSLSLGHCGGCDLQRGRSASEWPAPATRRAAQVSWGNVAVPLPGVPLHGGLCLLSPVQSPVYLTPNVQCAVPRSPVSVGQWQAVSQRLALALQDPGLLSPSPQSSVAASNFCSPTSKASLTPVHVEHWQCVGQRMAQVFQDTGLLSPTSSSVSRASPQPSPLGPGHSPHAQYKQLLYSYGVYN
mmetsp:Transcript_74046/g.239387  ORF Transcript_74046/g.239387 Transcript_74046/m.239387 type:complete len:271 (+) Transcript_74046:78-890(+)